MRLVERSFAHAGRCRRLARDHEATPAAALGFFVLANAMLLVRRLARNHEAVSQLTRSLFEREPVTNAVTRIATESFMPVQNPLETVLVADLIHRERAARDACLWPEMLACWHSESYVDVSWFQGSGADFTAASQRDSAASQTLSFHQMAPSVVTVRGDRALADTGCAIHAMRLLGEVEVAVISHTRLLSRALRQGDDWLIAGLRMIYICDLLVPRDPTRMPEIDQSVLQGFRTSYRYLSFILTQSGHVPRMDLPGIDKPETVTVLYAEERYWLEKNTRFKSAAQA